MSAPIVGWPLPPEQGELVATLAGLVRRGGSARLVDARVVAADLADFPDPWEPSLANVHQLLYRVAWHAYLDLEIVVADRRWPKAPDGRMLTRSALELASATVGKATFALAALGNDDVAGRAALAIGDAYLAIAPRDPFREAEREVSDAEVAIAAIYLGLGVLVANASMYRRIASCLRGESVVYEEYVEQTGGLSIGDATLLLAVQDLVRDDHSPALASLLPPQQEWLARWRAELEPHADEVRALLGLADADAGPALSRPPAPRSAPAAAEPELRDFNRGRKTFRVANVSLGRAVLGMLVGSGALLLPMAVVAGPLAILAGAAVGFAARRRYFMCSDPQCRRVMATELDTCPGCGGTILETIRDANDRLERLEALEGAAATDDDVS
jgi:hypothetical protein